MSVKYFDKEKEDWIIFPGTVGAPGKSAYQYAVEAGYAGNVTAFITALKNAGELLVNVDFTPIKNSRNLIFSGGVYDEIDKLNEKYNSIVSSYQISINNIQDTINSVQSTLLNIPTNSEVLNLIEGSIVDSLESVDTNKSLSANQGKVLKGLIDNINSSGSGSTITIDAELSSTSINPVQNKVINASLTSLTSRIQTLESLSTIDISSLKSEIISELSETFVTQDELGSLGGGDVSKVGDLEVDKIILGSGSNSIKKSSYSISDFATKTEFNTLQSTVANINLDNYVTKVGLASELEGKNILPHSVDASSITAVDILVRNSADNSIRSIFSYLKGDVIIVDEIQEAEAYNIEADLVNTNNPNAIIIVYPNINITVSENIYAIDDWQNINNTTGLRVYCLKYINNHLTLLNVAHYIEC